MPAARTAGLAAGSVGGFGVGVLSGFTGVGGGEYRAPVLLQLLRDIRWTIAANLAVGVVVSVFGFVFRQGYLLPLDHLLLVLAMTAPSLPGAYVGAAATKSISSRGLKLLLAGILVATALRLILVETETTEGFVLDWQAVGLAMPLGFGFGLISGILGLAAGEYRIPALILFFGLPASTAGTMSSLAAIPQQALALWKHRELGHTTGVTNRLGAAMAVASVAGVALGVLALGRATDNLVARVLGIAMLGAAVRISWEVRRPDASEAAMISTATPAGPGDP